MLRFHLWLWVKTWIHSLKHDAWHERLNCWDVFGFSFGDTVLRMNYASASSRNHLQIELSPWALIDSTEATDWGHWPLHLHSPKWVVAWRLSSSWRRTHAYRHAKSCKQPILERICTSSLETVLVCQDSFSTADEPCLPAAHGSFSSAPVWQPEIRNHSTSIIGCPRPSTIILYFFGRATVITRDRGAHHFWTFQSIRKMAHHSFFCAAPQAWSPPCDLKSSGEMNLKGTFITSICYTQLQLPTAFN